VDRVPSQFVRPQQAGTEDSQHQRKFRERIGVSALEVGHAANSSTAAFGSVFFAKEFFGNAGTM
jgi:hypothetical protein